MLQNIEFSLSIYLNMKNTRWIFIIYFLEFLVDVSEAGECCKAYYDLTFDYHDETWCDNYCCGTSALGVLTCCDNIFLVAPEDDRVGFCTDYFVKNIWAPILIAVGGFGILLTCCVCCACCLGVCGNKSSGRVVAPAHQPYHTNVMMLNPAAAAYPPPPGYSVPMAPNQPMVSSLPLQNPGYIPSGDGPPAHPSPAVAYPVPTDQQTESKLPISS